MGFRVWVLKRFLKSTFCLDLRQLESFRLKKPSCELPLPRTFLKEHGQLTP